MLRQALFDFDLLFIGAVKGGIDVLTAAAIPGAAVFRPEDAEQVAIGDSLRIVVNRERFRLIAEIVVGRLFLFAPAIPDTGAKNAIETPELRVWTPKSAEAEGGGLVFDPGGFPISRQCRRRDDSVFGWQIGFGRSA